MSSNPRSFNIFPLLLVNFTAMTAVQSVLPIAGSIARALNLYAWQMGLSFGVVGVAWALCSKSWGKVTDKNGRVFAMKFAFTGYLMAFATLAIYLTWALEQAPDFVPSVLLTMSVMIIARIFIGVFYSGIPISCITYIADHTSHEDRASAIAKFMSSGAIATALCPILAGFVSKYSLSLTVITFAITPLLALPFLYKLKETKTTYTHQDKPRLKITDKRIRVPAISILILFSSLTITNLCMGFYIIDKFHLSKNDAANWSGIILGSLGIAMTIMQIIVSKKRTVTPITWISTGLPISIFGIVMTLLVASPIYISITAFIIGLGLGMSFPATSAIASNAVEPHEQAACSATMSAAQGLGITAAPILGTLMYDWQYQSPYILIGVLLTILCVMVWRYKADK